MKFSDKLTNIFRNVADKGSEFVALIATVAPVAAAGYIAHKSGLGAGGAAVLSAASYAFCSATICDMVKNDKPEYIPFVGMGPGVLTAIPSAAMVTLSRPELVNNPTMIAAAATVIGAAIMAPPLWHLRNVLKM